MRNCPAPDLQLLFKHGALKNLRTLALLILVGATLDISVLAQATFNWSDGSGDHNTNTSGNWTGGVLPTTGSNIIFGTGGVQSGVNFNADFSANLVTFNGTIGYIINGTNTLQLSGASAGVTNDTSAASSIFVNVPINLAGNVTVTSTAGATAGLQFGGNLSGTGDITIVNNSSQSLQFSGIDSRTSSNTIISTGAFTVGNGTLTTSMIAGNVSNSGVLNFFSAAGAAQTYGGVISGTGNVSLFALSGVNNATLTLSGANTYSGNTTISNGTLADGMAGAFSSNSIVRVGNSGSNLGTLAVNFNETIAGLQNGGTGGGGEHRIGCNPDC